MINNSLTLIGYAISNYETENIENPYSPMMLRIEVEFYGMKKYDERVIEIFIPYIYKKRIDTTKQVLGKMLIIEGTIIPKINPDTNKIEYRPTAKDIYIVGDVDNPKDIFEKEESDE